MKKPSNDRVHQIGNKRRCLPVTRMLQLELVSTRPDGTSSTFAYNTASIEALMSCQLKIWHESLMRPGAKKHPGL
jgi:hypothetical protein